MDYTVFFILTALLLAAPALFVPAWRRRFFARFTRARSETARTAVEDALKHAFDCRTRAVACTIESIAGTLQTTTALATRLVMRLEAMGLLVPEERGFRLTEEAPRMHSASSAFTGCGSGILPTRPVYAKPTGTALRSSKSTG